VEGQELNVSPRILKLTKLYELVHCHDEVPHSCSTRFWLLSSPASQIANLQFPQITFFTWAVKVLFIEED
jgi:hypothetical protein